MAEPTPGKPVETNEHVPVQLVPRAIPRERSKENPSGYDCEFVEPPSELQTECPVCLLVLKEPCIISCCGHKFCRECIERIEKDKKPCALCSDPNFTFIRERALERTLKDLEVWCSYRKEGCEWKGKLRKLEEHLNRNPSPENRLNGCQFVAVECTHKCGAWFQRHHITTHETQLCKKRPYSCDHCQDYHSTFEDVIEVHYPQCGKYLVACPNDCDVYMIERQKLESHLKEQCPLVLVNCPFNFAGCETQLPRKDMPDHMRESIHLTLIATVTQKMSAENQQLMKANQELQQKVIEREDESRQNVATFHASLQELGQKYNSVVEENRRLRKDLNDEKKVSQESLRQLNKVSRDIKDCKKEMNQELQEHVNKQELKEIHSRLDKYSSVVKETQHLHSNLNKETKQLIKTMETVRKSCCPSYATCCKGLAFGVLLLFIYATLATFDTRLANMKEEIQLEVQHLSSRSGFPVDYRVNQTDKAVYLEPAFYTHQHGYRMCVCVYPNGVGDGNGTHVTISTFMMQGPFDDYLKWPFRGKITIQIVNQVGDHDHVEEVIPYNDQTPDISAGRVTGKKRSDKGWGFPQFLAHDKLKYNAKRKTQYLKDNTLHIRVMKVTLS